MGGALLKDLTILIDNYMKFRSGRKVTIVTLLKPFILCHLSLGCVFLADTCMFLSNNSKITSELSMLESSFSTVS